MIVSQADTASRGIRVYSFRDCSGTEGIEGIRSAAADCISLRDIAGQQFELIQAIQIDSFLVYARQYVQHLPVRAADISGDIAVESTGYSFAVAEIYLYYRNRPNALPAWLEGLVYELSYFFIREQHGSRQSSVGSTEAIIEPAHHLKEKNGLA